MSCPNGIISQTVAVNQEKECVRVRGVCVHGRMVHWFALSISNRNIAGSISPGYSYTRLSSPSLSLGGYKQPNEYGSVCCGKTELSLAKNSHWKLCGTRPGSSTVVVNSISFAT